jgi:chitodextrinase
VPAKSSRESSRPGSTKGWTALLRVAAAGGLAVALAGGLTSASASQLNSQAPSRSAAIAPARPGGHCRGARRATARSTGACRDALAVRGFGSGYAFSGFPFTSTSRYLSVSITSGPAAGSTSSSSGASFGFSSRAWYAGFRCSIDAGPYASCTSPTAFTGLANGVHTFRVFAVAGGASGRVASDRWTVNDPPPTTPPPVTPPADTTPPSAPTGLFATAGDTQVSLSWNASTDNIGVAGYRVFRNGTQVAQVTTTTVNDTGLTDGTTYSYFVKAFDAAGNVSLASTAVSSTPAAPSTPPPPPPVGGSPPPPITAWVASNSVSFAPLSDQAAAADVIPTPENRPGNTPTNNYMPTSAQLHAFYTTINSNGQTVVAANPYDQFVTGHYTGTTDEIIQWGAWKWGIPEDWLRAEYVQESRWNQSQLGDIATVSSSVYNLYPPQSRAGNNQVYESLGITQVKWIPDGSVGAGTEPLRWESTAFNVDYQCAQLRFYFDNPRGLRSAWGDPSYSAGNGWESLGGWFEPYPWLNSGQANYISQVQGHLAARTWAQPGF